MTEFPRLLVPLSWTILMSVFIAGYLEMYKQDFFGYFFSLVFCGLGFLWIGHTVSEEENK